MNTRTKFIWKKAQSYSSHWKMHDEKKGLYVGCSFLPSGQYDLYQPLLSAEAAPYELGYIAYSIRHRHLGMQTNKTKKLWNVQIEGQSSFSINQALSMKRPSTREMLGCAKSVTAHPENASQKRRRAINDLLIKRIHRWVQRYGLLSNKSNIFLDEWTTTSLEFEWVFTYSSLIQYLIQNHKFSSDADVAFREGVEENFPTLMKLSDATDLINNFIGKRLSMHTESLYNNFDYSLIPNSLTGALWMIIANHLKQKKFFSPCINQFTPCLQFIPDTRPGRQGNAACSNACRQRAFYWKEKSNTNEPIVKDDTSIIMHNALLERHLRFSDPLNQIKSIK